MISGGEGGATQRLPRDGRAEEFHDEPAIRSKLFV